jgi:thymidylate kinase
MGDAPVYVLNHALGADMKDEVATQSEQPVLPEGIDERRSRLQQLHDQHSYFLDKIAGSRVLIIEGISGSGKDTFQTYLKTKLEGRDVYDYSEGELLHSWKHLQIEGILKLRVKFMLLFVNYIKDVVSRDEKAVFLLNRFHLSTYVSTIIHQPTLEKEYVEIINVLRMLPVHVFILRLDKSEIKERSLHPERSIAWQMHQRQIIKKEGFRDTLERHLWQQDLILEAAERQKIPYSVIKFNVTPQMGAAGVGIPEPLSPRRGKPMNAADAKNSRRKGRLPETV